MIDEINEPKLHYVTAHSMEGIDDLYTDMESSGGNLYIPNRRVDCAVRLPNSRATGYMLTRLEAQALKKDPRVLDVELNHEDRGVKPMPMGWSVPASAGVTYRRSGGSGVYNDVNWGTYRILKGQTNSGWGSGFNDTQTGITNVSVDIQYGGEGVDVVIVDGGVVPVNHPEYAVNADGTGGSRCVQYDWCQHDTEAIGYARTGVSFKYDGSRVPFDNHAIHVTGTAAGNRNGLARNSAIYNIPYAGSYGGNGGIYGYAMEYVRAFHRSKPVGPSGYRRPTVVNNSWAYTTEGFFKDVVTDIATVVYRGVSYSGADITPENCYNWKIFAGPYYPYQYLSAWRTMSTRSAFEDASFQDAMNDGILTFQAAGNFNNFIAEDNDLDWDNCIYWNQIWHSPGLYDNKPLPPNPYFYCRGHTPGQSGGNRKMSIGAIDSIASPIEQKGDFSMWGPGVSMWAPGVNIISAHLQDTIPTHASYPTIADGRNASYFLGKLQGTSMATPHVTGLAACIVSNPDYYKYNQASIKKHLLTMAETSTIRDEARNWSLADAGISALFHSTGQGQ